MMEIIAVVGILSVGLLGVSSLVVQNLQAKNINQNYLIASMLAQEGAELVRNIRDENWLINNEDPVYWKLGNGTGTDIQQDGVYVIDYGGGPGTIINDTTPNVSSISDAGAKLYLDPSGFYTHKSAGNKATPFSRIVQTSFSGNSEVTILVKVHWLDRGRNQEYDVDLHLLDWR